MCWPQGLRGQRRRRTTRKMSDARPKRCPSSRRTIWPPWVLGWAASRKVFSPGDRGTPVHHAAALARLADDREGSQRWPAGRFERLDDLVDGKRTLEHRLPVDDGRRASLEAGHDSLRSPAVGSPVCARDLSHGKGTKRQRSQSRSHRHETHAAQRGLQGVDNRGILRRQEHLNGIQTLLQPFRLVLSSPARE